MPFSLVIIRRSVAHVLTRWQCPDRLLSMILTWSKVWKRSKTSFTSLIGLIWKPMLSMFNLDRAGLLDGATKENKTYAQKQVVPRRSEDDLCDGAIGETRRTMQSNNVTYETYSSGWCSFDCARRTMREFSCVSFHWRWAKYLRSYEGTFEGTNEAIKVK